MSDGFAAWSRMKFEHYRKQGRIDVIGVNDDNRARVVAKLTEKTGLDYSAWSNDQLYKEAHFVGIFGEL